MKKFIILTFSFFITFCAFGQNVVISKKLVTLTPGQQDTIYFPMADNFAPSGTWTNLPDNANWSGSLRFVAQLDTGQVSDSLAALLKPVDETLLFYRWITAGDSCWTFGSTAFTTYVAVGDSNKWSSGCSGIFDPTPNIGLIVKMGDLSGGTRRWLFELVKEK